MPHRDVNGKRRSEAGAHDVRSEPPDPHPLVPPPDTGLDGERARPDAESGGEDREKLPVRCPADGPRAETHAEGGTVEPGETRARRPGTHVHQQHGVPTGRVHPIDRFRQRASSVPPPP